MRRLLSALLLVLLLRMVPFALAEGDFSEAFEGVFLPTGEAPVVTDTSYQSQNIAIGITLQRFEKTDVYVADIHVRTLECLTRAYAKGAWGKATYPVSRLAEESGAILALTGDSSQNFTSGWVVGNGKTERDGVKRYNTIRDLCVLYRDGTMRTLRSPSKEQNQQIAQELDSIWHIFLFGPALLDETGKALTKFDTSTSRQVNGSNPRAVLGYYEPGHYCFVQVDGRQTASALEEHEVNLGLKLPQLARLMESLGCKAAYNLDGGRSAMLWFNGRLVSRPAAPNRGVGDILVIKE